MRWATLLIEHPWLSLAPAGALFFLWRWSRAHTALIATLLWTGYVAWEYAIGHAGPDADIRIDLLLIYPVLAVATIAAVILGLKKKST